MPHVLVAGTIHKSGIDLLAAAPGVSFDLVEEVSEASYAPLIGRADALIIRTQPLSAATLAQAPRLRIVSRHGVGYDAVDLAALNTRGIPLTIVGDVNSVSVAEHAMMLILALAKHLTTADHAVRSGGWNWRNAMLAAEVAGRHLLIVGYGRIGRRLAAMAQGFGMTVSAFDPYLSQADLPLEADLAAALARADHVSVHVPHSGKPLIGAAELAAIKPGATLINTARGGVIDEVALAAALRGGRLGGVGLDVFATEPPVAQHPLFAFENVILTPHIAGLTRQSAERMAVASVQNVLDCFAGTLDRDLVVNREHADAGQT